MRIREFDIGRFFVKGTTEYLVDINALQFNGQCACEDFQFRCQLAIEKEIKDTGQRKSTLRCKHIKAVLDNLKGV